MLDELMVVTTESLDELVARCTFPKCDCEAELHIRRDGTVDEPYRCGCHNELILGPDAAAQLTETDRAIRGHRDVATPWGETVQVAWALRAPRRRMPAAPAEPGTPAE